MVRHRPNLAAGGSSWADVTWGHWLGIIPHELLENGAKGGMGMGRRGGGRKSRIWLKDMAQGIDGELGDRIGRLTVGL